MGFRCFFTRKKSKKSDKEEAAAATNMVAVSPPLQPTTNKLLATEVEELTQVFNKFDVNGDGKISSSEIGSILSSLGHKASEEMLEKMITEFDADGDGFIDLEEFVELNTRRVDTNEAMEHLRDAFSVYDIDGNGSISAEELHKVMCSLGEECSLQECRRMIVGVDSDGDGLIDFDEFKVMMMMGVCWDSSNGPSETICFSSC